MTDIRNTQDVIEVLDQPTNIEVRITHDLVELLNLSISPIILTQYVVETLVDATLMEQTRFVIIIG